MSIKKLLIIFLLFSALLVACDITKYNFKVEIGGTDNVQGKAYWCKDVERVWLNTKTNEEVTSSWRAEDGPEGEEWIPVALKLHKCSPNDWSTREETLNQRVLITRIGYDDSIIK